MADRIIHTLQRRLNLIFEPLIGPMDDRLAAKEAKTILLFLLRNVHKLVVHHLFMQMHNYDNRYNGVLGRKPDDAGHSGADPDRTSD